DSIAGWIAGAELRLVRRGDRRRMADHFGMIMRTIGPWLFKPRIGRANLKAAFPDKSDTEIELILDQVWDNLRRVVAEFAHLDQIQIGNSVELGCADVIFDSKSLAVLDQIRKNAKPAIYFAAHLANWEIPALVAPLVGLKSYVLYQTRNTRGV